MGDIESCGCESEPHTCDDPDIADLERQLDDLQQDRNRTAEQLAARDAALGACAARIAELLAQVGALSERRDALLALVANISQTTPLPSELEGWEGQRAALVAEVGTLRARVAEAERERNGVQAENRTLRRHLAIAERDADRFAGLADVMLQALERAGSRAAEAERQVTACYRAIGAVLERVQSDPDVRYLLGPGSDVFARLVDAEAAITGDDPEAVAVTRAAVRPPALEPEVLRLRRLAGEREARAAEAERERDVARADRDAAVSAASIVGRNVDWRARALVAERERDDDRAKVEEASGLCGDLLESLRVASKTSDGYRDAHAAYQRWAAKLAPDAIGDEQKRAAIDARLARPPLGPAHRGALIGLLEHAEQQLEDADRPHKVDAARAQIAALRAVLGEEAKS